MLSHGVVARFVVVCMFVALLPLQPTAQAAGSCSVGVGGTHATIQAAIDDSACVTVQLGAQTYLERLRFRRSVTLQGSPGITKIDGSAGGQVVSIASGSSVILADIIVRNGKSNLAGSAIGSEGTLTLRGVQVQDNQSLAGSETVTPSPIVYASGPLTIERSTFSSNKGGEGTVVSTSSLDIRESTIRDNTGDGLVVAGSSNVTNVTIAGNTGTGLRTSAGDQPITTRLTNVTIAENGNQGASLGGTTTATNITIAANRSNTSSTSGLLFSGKLTIVNSIVALDYADNDTLPVCQVFGEIVSNGHNIETGNSCGFNQASDKQNATIGLLPLRDNGGTVPTVALRLGSIAIDSGDASACPATDARGVARPQQGASALVCDVGAYEFQTGPTITTLNPPALPRFYPGSTLTVNGSGFTNGATVYWAGQALPTTFVDSTKLLAVLDADLLGYPNRSTIDLSKPQAIELFVINGGTSGSSNTTSFQITPAQPPSYTELVGGAGGGTGTVAVSGTQALIGEGTHITVLDVSNPAAPARISSYQAKGYVQDIELIGDRAYVTLGYGGLLILDVSEPTNLRSLGSFDTGGYALDIQVVGSRAYIADGPQGGNIVPYGGLLILDVANPAAPQKRGALTNINAYDLQIDGTTAYIACGSQEVCSVDVGNPSAPVLLRQSYDIGTSAVSGVAVVPDGILVAAGGKDLVVLDKNGLGSRATLDLPGRAKDVTVAGTTAYVTSYEGYVHIVDITTITSPKLRASYATNGSSWDVRLLHNRAYIADGFGGLEIADVTNSAKPKKLGDYLASSVAGFVRSGNLAYTYGESKANVVDVSNPAATVVQGTIPLTAEINDGDAEGKRFFLAQGGTAKPDPNNPGSTILVGGALRIFDLSNTQQPQELSTYSVGSAYSVDVVGTTAYLCADDGLYIFDVANPQTPRLRTRFEPNFNTNGGCYGVQVIDAKAYVATQPTDHSGFSIIDVHNPDAPTILSETGVYGYEPARFWVEGTTAYILSQSAIRVYDIGNSLHPSSRGIYYPLASPGMTIYGITIHNGITYIAQGDGLGNDGELEATDLNDLDRPRVLWTLRVPPTIRGVEVEGDLAYLATMQGGLQIFNMRNELLARTGGATPNGGNLTNYAGTLSVTFPIDATGPISVTIAGLPAPIATLGTLKTPLVSFLLEARDRDGRPVVQFAQPYTLTVRYTDAQLATAGIDEQTLNLAFWNGEQWVKILPCAGCSLDTATNTLTARLDHMTEFVLYSDQTPPEPPKPPDPPVSTPRRVYVPITQK